MKLNLVEPTPDMFPAEPCLRSRVKVSPLFSIARTVPVPVRLKGDHVTLGPLKELDPVASFKWLQDPDVTLAFVGGLTPKTVGEQKRWIASQLRAQGKTDITYVIRSPDGQAIGTCALNDIDWLHKNAKLGVLIGEKEFWGRGFGEDAAKTLIKFGFTRLKLNKIYAYILSIAQRALDSAQQAGLKEEGRLRGQAVVRGKLLDTVALGILKSDFNG